jgi:hypothetical protein
MGQWWAERKEVATDTQRRRETLGDVINRRRSSMLRRLQFSVLLLLFARAGSLFTPKARAHVDAAATAPSLGSGVTCLPYV